MIKIPFENISDKVNASEKLTKGLRLIDTFIEDMVVPENIIPVIAGGAVRDVLIKGDDPHDIDIFFVRNNNGVGSEDLSLLRDNLILWLEDRDISWTSLVNSSTYNSEDSYMDILDFVFEGVNIQLMIPNTIRSADGLVERFPIMCRAVCNKTGLYFAVTGFAAMSFDRPVMLNDRDFRYCQKKYAGQESYAFATGNELYYTWLGRHTPVDSEGNFDLVSTTIPQEGTVFTSWPNGNSMSTRFQRVVREFFGVGEETDLTNRNHSSDMGGRYATSRRSASQGNVTALAAGQVQTASFQWAW